MAEMCLNRVVFESFQAVAHYRRAQVSVTMLNLRVFHHHSWIRFRNFQPYWLVYFECVSLRAAMPGPMQALYSTVILVARYWYSIHLSRSDFLSHIFDRSLALAMRWVLSM